VIADDKEVAAIKMLRTILQDLEFRFLVCTEYPTYELITTPVYTSEGTKFPENGEYRVTLYLKDAR
jgi:hypothetical protein